MGALTRGYAREHRAVPGGTINSSARLGRFTAAGAVAAVVITATVAVQSTPVQAGESTPPAAISALVDRAAVTGRASRGTTRTVLFGPAVPARIGGGHPRAARVARKARPVVRPVATERRRVEHAQLAGARVHRLSRTVRHRPVARVLRRVIRRAVGVPRAGAAAVVAYAQAAIGRPYISGAAGPGAYDCSGLTMRAFARAGKRLPHKAARQTGRPVGLGQARPGDLVKWGGYHVGIYVGGGYVIHAPKPGDRVKRAHLWGSYRIVRVL